MTFSKFTRSVFAFGALVALSSSANAEREAGGRLAPRAIVINFPDDAVDKTASAAVLALAGDGVKSGEVALFVNQLDAVNGEAKICIEPTSTAFLQDLRTRLAEIRAVKPSRRGNSGTTFEMVEVGSCRDEVSAADF